MSDFLQSLIDGEKAAMQPPAGAMEANWSALEASIAAGVAPPPIDLPSLGGAAPIAWLAGIIGGASVLAVVAYVAMTPAIEIETAPLPTPPPVIETSSVVSTPPPVRPLVIEKPPAKRRPRPKPRPSLAVQIQVLRKAQLAFARGNAVQALELVGMHREKFPKTPLEQERSALEALASCRLKRAEGVELGRLFLERWPKSPQADRVRQACSRP